MSNTIRLLAIFLLLMGCVFSYSANSTSYAVGSMHMGSVGGIGNSTSYQARSTTTYQQPSSSNGVSASYVVNVGWFPTNISYGAITLTSYIYDPHDGESFGPGACSVVIRVSINTTAPLGSTKNTVCRFYTRQNVNMNWTYNDSLSASTTALNTSVNKTFYNTYAYWLVNCSTTVLGQNASTQNVSFTNAGNGPGFCSEDGVSMVVDLNEYAIVSMVMLALTFLYFMRKWDELNPFLAPLSNFIGMIGLMFLATTLLGLYLVAGGAYDTPFYAGVFVFVVFGLYLMVRLLIMAWITIRAIMWR